MTENQTIVSSLPTSRADARYWLGAALDQTGAVFRGVRADQFALPTPCEGHDVGWLVGHLLGVLNRFRHIGTGGAPFEVPSVIEGVADPVGEWDASRGRLEAVWADDAILTRTLRMPWGEADGSTAVRGYTQEILVHGWDLAVATGRRDLLDEALAVECLGFAQRLVPASPRGGFVPFGEVVEVDAAAGPYERLVGWLGRDPDPWPR